MEIGCLDETHSFDYHIGIGYAKCLLNKKA